MRILLLSFLLTAGCATLPLTGERDSGEPLKVVVNSETHSQVVRDNVGTAEHRDASGRLYGKTQIYENRVAHFKVTTWFPTQGGRKLDDEDFFRIAGDSRTATEIRAHREAGVTMNRVGMGLTFGGALLAGLGYLALPQVNKQTPMINYGVSLGGVAAVATGIYLWIFGNRRVDPEVHPVNDWRRAQEAAEAYNGSREGRNAKSDLPPPARI